MHLMNAAGWVKTIGDVRELARAPITHVVLGSSHCELRHGNPEPTVCWLDDRAYNSRGLPGPAKGYYEAHGQEIAQIVHDAGKLLIQSITSTESESDWITMTEVVMPYTDIIELNLSCPNKWSHGARAPIIAQDPDATAKVLREVKSVLRAGIPIWAKLSPVADAENDPMLIELAQAIRESGIVTALVCGNTILVDTPIIDGKPAVSMPKCGLSGPALTTYSLQLLDRMSEMLPDMPIYGAGGIECGEDALKYLRRRNVAGIQIGTHFFKFGAKVFEEILQGLA
jgi:dihydroorotate dehydrogenase